MGCRSGGEGAGGGEVRVEGRGEEVMARVRGDGDGAAGKRGRQSVMRRWELVGETDRDRPCAGGIKASRQATARLHVQ